VKRRAFLAGSTAINGFGNDIDVVLVYDDLSEAADCLEEAGWELKSAEVYRGITSDGWFSARLGEINLLVSDEDAAELWRIATDVCKQYVQLVGRPSTKEERVALHKAVFND